MGGRGPPPRRPPPCRFRGGGGSVSCRTDALHHRHAALRCRITCIMYPELLSVINVVQAQGALCAPIGGQPASILRVLQPGIVFCLGRGRRLFERDMRRSCDCPPGQPAQVDRHRGATARRLYRRQKAQHTAGEGSAVRSYVRAGHLYEKFAKAPRTAFRRGPGDFFGDGARYQVEQARRSAGL